jgi:hypothetical protein
MACTAIGMDGVEVSVLVGTKAGDGVMTTVVGELCAGAGLFVGDGGAAVTVVSWAVLVAAGVGMAGSAASVPLFRSTNTATAASAKKEANSSDPRA